ncbi:MAG: recombinase family protein, partial [Planctomycetaceae bacterium]|nr:recombinase family protein [Planctomycetaceae bacterium]
MKKRRDKIETFSARTNWVRHKLVKLKGGRLRVMIYARYSTDDQDQSSIVDQVHYCKAFLKALGLAESDYNLEVLSDEGVSGEKIRRPGIDLVWEGIYARRWYLIVAEDSSRLYRDAASCVQLIRSALDQRLRVLCINDEVDTADEENWEERLFDAARHHQRTNKYTARRIKRKHEALWEMGAAIGLVKPGYLRKASQPSVDGEPEEGPYFDEVDPRWTATVYEAFERVAAQESSTSVAAWLTKRGFPKSSNSLNSALSADNVKALIRRWDYRGVQRFREKVSKKVWSTGCHRAEPSSEDEVLTRDMPHLRIVPDWLWYAANKAINERRPKDEVLSGVDHGLYGIPRDSRGPLSNLFRCRCCGA